MLHLSLWDRVIYCLVVNVYAAHSAYLGLIDPTWTTCERVKQRNAVSTVIPSMNTKHFELFLDHRKRNRTRATWKGKEEAKAKRTWMLVCSDSILSACFTYLGSNKTAFPIVLIVVIYHHGIHSRLPSLLCSFIASIVAVSCQGSFIPLFSRLSEYSK